MFSIINPCGISSLRDVTEEGDDVEESLQNLAMTTQATQVNVYPNFKNHKLLPPTCGVALNYRLQERFYADAFRVDKYRIMAMAKLNFTQENFTTEKAKEFERIARRCLNYDSITPPAIEDD